MEAMLTTAWLLGYKSGKNPQTVGLGHQLVISKTNQPAKGGRNLDRKTHLLSDQTTKFSLATVASRVNHCKNTHILSIEPPNSG
jgi:hypothetical protein